MNINELVKAAKAGDLEAREAVDAMLAEAGISKGEEADPLKYERKADELEKISEVEGGPVPGKMYLIM